MPMNLLGQAYPKRPIPLDSVTELWIVMLFVKIPIVGMTEEFHSTPPTQKMLAVFYSYIPGNSWVFELEL